MKHTSNLTEAIVVFADELPEIRKGLLDNADYMISQNTPYKELDIDALVTLDDIHHHDNFLRVEEGVKPIFNTVRRIDSYRFQKENPHVTPDITNTDIQRAREVDSDWFITEAQLSTKRPHNGMCLFHADKTPSLMLMKSKQTGNSYLKCFVCNEAWDSIGFIMKRDNVDFIKAVMVVNR